MKTEAEKRAAEKYRLKHRVSDDVYLQDRRGDYNKDEWKEIPGLPGYEISIYGDVYFKGDVSGKLRRKSGICVQHRNRRGYMTVAINIDGVKKRMFVHRLLAITYIENPENKKEIDHIDGNPSNNSLDNLRWATPKENSNNNISLERMRKSHIGKESNIKGRKKVWIDKERNIYKMI